MHDLTLDDKEDKGASNSDQADGREETSQENDQEQAIAKRKYVLHELIETEKDYVNNLSLIVEGYVNFLRSENSDIQIPEDLKNGKDKIIFGNIEAIFEWHRELVLHVLCVCFICS